MFSYTFDWQDDGGYIEIENLNKMKSAEDNKTTSNNSDKKN